MIVDSHMHVWSMKDVDYYNDKDIYTYMAENKIDKTVVEISIISSFLFWAWIC